MIQIAADGEQVQAVQVQMEADFLRVAVDPDEPLGRGKQEVRRVRSAFELSKRTFGKQKS